MKACILFAGLLVLSARFVFGFEDTKLPFTCQEDDIQWAGMTCPENEPCPVYLELSSVGSTGSRVFLAGNVHSAQMTLYSLLLSSEDAGATWKEPLGRVRGELLDRIQFQNFETGWISGQRAVPLPGDPFLLITHDGGRNWRKVPVLPEGSPGSILKFRFDSALNGRLAMDRESNDPDDPRYALYETKDGAETWKLAEASSGALKNAPISRDDSGWRLVAEKDGKTMAVERLAGEKWVVAARFAIQIGECREQ
jgi:photosystem II stability/assembly factor-like uncharacterized protein